MSWRRGLRRRHRLSWRGLPLLRDRSRSRRGSERTRDRRRSRRRRDGRALRRRGGRRSRSRSRWWRGWRHGRRGLDEIGRQLRRDRRLLFFLFQRELRRRRRASRNGDVAARRFVVRRRRGRVERRDLSFDERRIDHGGLWLWRRRRCGLRLLLFVGEQALGTQLGHDLGGHRPHLRRGAVGVVLSRGRGDGRRLIVPLRHCASIIAHDAVTVVILRASPAGFPVFQASFQPTPRPAGSLACASETSRRRWDRRRRSGRGREEPAPSEVSAARHVAASTKAWSCSSSLAQTGRARSETTDKRDRCS